MLKRKTFNIGNYAECRLCLILIQAKPEKKNGKTLNVNVEDQVKDFNCIKRSKMNKRKNKNNFFLLIFLIECHLISNYH